MNVFSKVSLVLIGALLIGACSNQKEVSRSTDSADVMDAKVLQVLADDGAWCWFSDPRAVYYEGEHRRTYAGWISSSGDIQVGYYDHDSNKTQIHTLVAGFQADDHNNPSLLITEEGQLLVFYSEHATERPMLLSRSENPEDISEWEEPVELDLNNSHKYEGYSDTYTYTNPYYLSDEGKLYLYWRGSDFKPNFAVSDDMGKTWSKGKILILPDREYRDRRPYIKVSSNGKDNINFAFTQGHPRREPDNSIYYMSLRQGEYLKADGTVIADTSSAVTPEETDLVYDASNGAKSWIWDVTSDNNGYPVIAYSKFPDDSTHIYSYARWNGESWNNYDLTDSGKWFPETPEGQREPEPNYSGGLVLDHENSNVVYLSREVEGTFEIERWKTNDQGKSWDQEAITTNSSQDNVRPFAVRNAREGNSLQVLWMKNNKYVHYTDYSAEIQMQVEED